jgi:hypothetical protein
MRQDPYVYQLIFLNGEQATPASFQRIQPCGWSAIMRMMPFAITGVFMGLASSGGIHTALADSAVEQMAVPANEASFHVPVFQNDFIRLLNVDIPAGRSSGYHVHLPDLVTVVVEDSDSVAQEFGREPNPPAHQPRGNVVYTKYGEMGLTHNVTNAGRSPYHLIGVEVLKSQLGRFSPSSRADVPSYLQVIDNENVRGWRLVLEPGQSVAPITQPAPGIRIVVDGGEIAEVVPGHADRAMLLKSGEFAWQGPGITAGFIIVVGRVSNLWSSS